jgi:hypothetical protein
MKTLILRLLVVVLSIYVAGSVLPLFATQQQAPPAPPPSAPSGSPQLDTKMAGLQAGPPGSSYGGGGCGGGGCGGSSGPSHMTPSPPSPTPTETATTAPATPGTPATPSTSATSGTPGTPTTAKTKPPVTPKTQTEKWEEYKKRTKEKRGDVEKQIIDELKTEHEEMGKKAGKKVEDTRTAAEKQQEERIQQIMKTQGVGYDEAMAIEMEERR